MKKYELTNEQVKAIRIVNGYVSDLRHDISAAVNKQCMWDFIDENAANLFGLDILQARHDEDGILSNKYETALRRCVDGVCEGHKVKFEV